jgi:hypothetical protein
VTDFEKKARAREAVMSLIHHLDVRMPAIRAWDPTLADRLTFALSGLCDADKRVGREIRDLTLAREKELRGGRPSEIVQIVKNRLARDVAAEGPGAA